MSIDRNDFIHPQNKQDLVIKCTCIEINLEFKRFLWREENRWTRRKTLGAKGENQQLTPSQLCAAPALLCYHPLPPGSIQFFFIRGSSAPRCKPLSFHIPFLTEKVTLFYTFHRKRYPFHIPTVGSIPADSLALFVLKNRGLWRVYICGWTT